MQAVEEACQWGCQCSLRGNPYGIRNLLACERCICATAISCVTASSSFCHLGPVKSYQCLRSEHSGGILLQYIMGPCSTASLLDQDSPRPRTVACHLVHNSLPEHSKCSAFTLTGQGVDYSLIVVVLPLRKVGDVSTQPQSKVQRLLLDGHAGNDVPRATQSITSEHQNFRKKMRSL